MSSAKRQKSLFFVRKNVIMLSKNSNILEKRIYNVEFNDKKL